MGSEQGSKTKRVYLDFVGCRLNQAEIETLARQFAGQGNEIVPDAAQADLVVINSCAVTREAERKTRQMIRQLARKNPQAQITVTGCYAELSPEALAGLPQVAHVIGNRDKEQLVTLLDGGGPLYDREPIQREPLPPGTLGHTRAFVKVQDGCDNRCTFCVTTLARGEGRSRPPEDIIAEINKMAAQDYREAVLTGVHLGSYGRGKGDSHQPEPFDLFELVRALLLRTDIPRIRLSSLEPWDIHPGLFDLWQDDRLCAHLHLPLQSGSDRTLRRMARRTTQESFAALVAQARAHIPGVSITTDIMVGFPGETDADFEESLRFVAEMGFSRLHVFPYSAREGTVAARMPDQVPDAVKKMRKARMLTLSDELEAAFVERLIGYEFDVLWESARGATPDGFQWSGLAGNYVRVHVTSPRQLANTITWARVTGLADSSGVLGELTDE